MKSWTGGVIEGRAGLKLSEDDRLDSLMALACLEGPESTKSLQNQLFFQLFGEFWASPGPHGPVAYCSFAVLRCGVAPTVQVTLVVLNPCTSDGSWPISDTTRSCL